MIGEVDEAVKILEEWLQDEPGDPIAEHMLAASTGRGVPVRASDAFVEKTFDAFAASFEAKLESLSYRAPNLVAAALADAGSSRMAGSTSSTPAVGPDCAGHCFVRTHSDSLASTCPPGCSPMPEKRTCTQT